MSNVGSEAADQMIREGLEISESAIKLAGLGAKQLAALLLAVATENAKVKGETSLNRISRMQEPLSVYSLAVKDLPKFKSLCQEYGILYCPVFNQMYAKNGVCDVLVPERHAKQVNYIMEMMGMPAPGKEAKNDPPRDQSSVKSTERGNGWLDQLRSKFMGNEDHQSNFNLDGLDTVVLAAMIIQLAKENRQFDKVSDLAQVFGSSFDFAELSQKEAAAIQSQAKVLNIPAQVCELENGKSFLFSDKDNIPIINRLCELQGIPHAFPVQQAQEQQKQPDQKKQETEKRGPGRPRKEQTEPAETKAQDKASIKEKVEKAKETAKPQAPKREAKTQDKGR